MTWFLSKKQVFPSIIILLLYVIERSVPSALVFEVVLLTPDKFPACLHAAVSIEVVSIAIDFEI